MADRLDVFIERLLRELAPQVLSPVVRRFRDFAAAEDAVQEALIAAAAQWPREGMPANPRAWLIQVASRRMTDHIRSEVSRRHREQAAAEEAERLALPKGSVGPYQLQAAIAAVHDEAPCAENTDWPQILALYELLKRMSDNPMIVLSYAIAAAMVHGPEKGLELLSVLDSDTRLAERHRLEAVRAHLLEMTGDHEAAITHYRMAASRATSMPERNYLMMQAARLSDFLSTDPRSA